MSAHRYRLDARPETADDDPAVHELMTHRLVAITADATADVALRLLTTLGAHHLPVMAGPRCVGVVDEADLLRGLADGRLLVGHLARPVPMLQPDDRRGAAARRLYDEAAGAALVADGERLLGIVTVTDIVRSVAMPSGRRTGGATAPVRSRSSARTREPTG